MRLIDADALRQEIESKIYWGQISKDNVESLDEIDDAPTVDTVALPCKIGDDVYIIPSKEAFGWSMRTGHPENIRVYHQYVVCVTFTERGWHIVTNAEKEYGTGKVSVDSSYKETWFLTREEAEAALTKMKGGTSDA